MITPTLNKIDVKKGPYQLVHDFEFVALNLGSGYTEIRNMSEEEKYEYMCSRVKKLRDRGYGGVVLNTDFKSYLENSADIALCGRVAKYAKKIGMSVWIYDEQYYPSGAAGGLVLEGHPELEVLGLALITKQRETDGRTPIRVASPRGHSELKYAVAVPVNDGRLNFENAVNVSRNKDLSGGFCAYLPRGEWRVYCFFYRAIFEHSPYSRALRTSHRFVNIFDSRTAERFFDITYVNGYMKHFEGELSDAVDAVFTDEPHYPQAIKREEGHWQGVKYPSYSMIEEEEPDIELLPYVQWTEDMESRYFEEYGEDLIINLPHLFEKTQHSRRVRVNFYALTSRMARDGFVINYRNMLHNAGVRLSGHYLLEESFDCHATYFGDIIDHLSEFSIPGCDVLTTEPDGLRYSVAFKLASSASHLSGKDITMVEASNAFDKGIAITREKLKNAVTVMAAHGVNLVVSYWGEDILPPEQMSDFAGYLAKLSSLLSNGKYKIDTLLYYPYEQLCERTIPCGYVTEQQKGCDALSVSSCARTLLENQVCFDFINKKFLLESTLEKGSIVLPTGEKINRFVFPDIEWVDSEVSDFISRASKCGVEILSYRGNKIDGLNFVPKGLSAKELSSKEIKIEGNTPYFLVTHRQLPNNDLFMIVNTDNSPARADVKLLDCDNRYAIVDIDSYSTSPTEYSICGGYAKFDFEFAPFEAKIIMRYNQN